MEALEPRTALRLDNPQGLEILLLEGYIAGSDFELQPSSWMRLPAGEPLDAVAGKGGARPLDEGCVAGARLLTDLYPPHPEASCETPAER